MQAEIKTEARALFDAAVSELYELSRARMRDKGMTDAQIDEIHADVRPLELIQRQWLDRELTVQLLRLGAING
jgi:hypothetical protein